MNYSEFLDTKTHSTNEYGFSPLWIPPSAFDFQAALIEWSLQKGRSGIFADCGLGKTLIELAWSENVVRKTNGRVLNLTPLAVSHQTVTESEKFGIEAHRSYRGELHDGIVIANYERLHLFDPSDFVGLVCDECFAPGTLVDTPTGRKRIETLREGDYIVNCTGVDRISDVHKREVPYATLVKVGDTSFIASPNHPIFTQRGWVKKKG